MGVQDELTAGWLVGPWGFLGASGVRPIKLPPIFFLGGENHQAIYGILMEEFPKFTMLAVWVGFIS